MNTIEKRIDALEQRLTAQPAHELVVRVVDVDEAGVETLRSERRSFVPAPAPDIKIRVVRCPATPGL